MATGVVVDSSGFEIVAGDQRMGPRRALTEADEKLLSDLAARYVRAVQSEAGDDVFLTLGQELWSWLDGDQGELTALLARVSAPVTFEIRAERAPSERAWAVLRAPFELLARQDGGFLAADALVRFGVVRRLGVPEAAPEPDGYRLGLAFMASSPRRQHELDFEAEEAAILAAVDDTRVDLVVEDTGNPEELGRRLADLGGMPVVHLSCHGVNRYPVRAGQPAEPVLMMEDEVGDDLPTTAADLVRLMTIRPRLLFVSACLTATAAGAAGHLPAGAGRRTGTADGGMDPMLVHSMSTALVTAGVPAVLGWDGSVGDRAATVFAKDLYKQLSNRADLAVAVGDARRTLLNSDDRAVRTDWHLARLWLGPTGGGPLVTGINRRSRVSAVHGTKVFLDRKQHVPVAAPAMFVGRRPELQRALRALRGQDKAGVLLHGQGRLGKSSLAARIADRCPQLAPAVVFGDYSVAAILEAVDEAVRANPEARELIKRRRPDVRDRPEALEELLIDLLSGPCAQATDGRRPLLLVIDDLEQVLLPDPDGPHRVDSRVAPVLAGVLRVFDPSLTDSRLLMTSRFRFTLDGLDSRLEQVPLRPLSPVAQRKLLNRQQAQVTLQRRQERDALAERAMTVSRGNPGLQDLIGLRLVFSDQIDLGRAESAVAGMEDYLHQGQPPSEAKLREFLENLALDTLIEQAGQAHRALLRGLTLFDLPVPEPVTDTLAHRTGGSTTRLLGLGLLDVFSDAYDPQRPALAANALAAGRLDPLTSDKITDLAGVVIEPLYTAWGGDTERGRDTGLDLQLTRIALHADTPRVVADCAPGAVEALRSGSAVDAFRLGEEAITLLDGHQVPVPLLLLRWVAEVAKTSGDGQTAGTLYNRAIRQTQAEGVEQSDPLDRARVLAEHAIYLVDRGELQQAEQILRQAHQMFTAAGSEYEAARCQGVVADVLFRRGEYEEALRIHREIELPVYERLGQVRESAVAWGKVADIFFWRGESEEALRIRREVELPVYERLGDAHSVAVTWGQIADILFQRGESEEALRIRREVELPVYERLGDAHSVAATWGKVADILFRNGEHDEALRLRREVQLPVYERLQDKHSAAVTWGKVADILYWRGEYDEVLRIRREVELPVYERLGDAHSAAIIWGRIANIHVRRGEYDEAASLQTKRLRANERLGALDGIAAAKWELAQIDIMREDFEAAFPRLVESFQAFQQLRQADGIAIVGTTLGQFLVAFGRQEKARPVLEASLSAAEKIGATEIVQAIHQLMDGFQ
ncbi:CHAT domain-containing protein [Actinoplanes hulinensis]|uniref:CHAT domain-containing protein n=1 Tax=Actinoplanes hulinensis TaxID=1144547 RepID=A0ABS7BEJ6_9ACTN|nr:CHAT domain-containing protein [Actinoplanes hulinensis]MBW6439300.1 CHAT domain-containing protein [Actinoplanes hulinensis]